MADKLSALALREVGATPGVPDHTIEKLLDKYGPPIAKEARRRERQELLTAAGKQAIEEMSQLDTLRTERDARPTADALHHARVGAYWRGAMHWSVANLIIGAALACVAIFTMQGVIWDTAARSFREQAMTGALLSTQPVDSQ